MTIESQEIPSTGQSRITAIFDRFQSLDPLFHDTLLTTVGRGIADRYIEEHYQEIAALIDQQAIANMAVAEASNHISRSIDHSTAVNANSALLEAISTKKRRGYL